MGFHCPDALLGQIADFVLSLAEVDTAIIYCMRQNGVKFSARTTKRRLHCGNLLHDVLAQYGSGGGHACMAGGFAPYEKLPFIVDDRQKSIGGLVEQAVLEYISKKCPN